VPHMMVAAVNSGQKMLLQRETSQKLGDSEQPGNTQIVAGFLVPGLGIHWPFPFEEIHQTGC
jgi:hypothetical protein